MLHRIERQLQNDDFLLIFSRSWSTLIKLFTFQFLPKCQTYRMVDTERVLLLMQLKKDQLDDHSQLVTVNASMTASVLPHLRLSSPSQNFLNHQCTVCSLAVPGQIVVDVASCLHCTLLSFWTQIRNRSNLLLSNCFHSLKNTYKIMCKSH